MKPPLPPKPLWALRYSVTNDAVEQPMKWGLLRTQPGDRGGLGSISRKVQQGSQGPGVHLLVTQGLNTHSFSLRALARIWGLKDQHPGLFRMQRGLCLQRR